MLAPDDDPFVAPTLWLVGAQVFAGLSIHALLDTIGYRVPAILPGTPADEAQKAGVAAYTQRTVIRLALSELVALASLAYVFAMGGHDRVGYVTGALVSIVLLSIHVWPWSRPIDRTLAGLQRDGARVPLREAFGLEPKLTGPIQEL